MAFLSSISNRKKIYILIGLFLLNLFGFLIYVFVKVSALASFSIDGSHPIRTDISKEVELPVSLDFVSNSKKTNRHEWIIKKDKSEDVIYESQEKSFKYTFDQVGQYQIELTAMGLEGNDQEVKVLTLTLSKSFKEEQTSIFESIFKYHLNSQYDEATFLEDQKLNKIIESDDFRIIYLDRNGKEIGLSQLNFFLQKNQPEKIKYKEFVFNESGKITSVKVFTQFPEEKPKPSKSKTSPTPEPVDSIPPPFEGDDLVVEASFSLAKKRVNVNENVLFNNNSKNASRYEWDFDGDGKVDSKERVPEYSYKTEGKYLVQLTAYSKTNQSKSFSSEIEVLAPFNVGITASGKMIIRQPIKFYISNNAKNEIVDYLWSFGDGQSSTKKTPIHQFSTLGKYDVKVKCKDKYGRVGEAFYEIFIELPEEEISNKLTSIARLCSHHQSCRKARKDANSFLNEYFKFNKTAPVYENDLVQINDMGIEDFIKRITMPKKTVTTLIDEIAVSKIDYSKTDGNISGIYLKVKSSN